MRASFSRTLTVSLVAGAGLLAAACGGASTSSGNATKSIETVTTDNGVADEMTGIDAATGNGTLAEPAETNASTANAH